MTKSIDTKVEAGNFWGKNGAIADTRKLALLALNQPDSNLFDGLSLMINIHTRASDYSEKALKKASMSYRIRLWKKRHKEAEPQIRF